MNVKIPRRFVDDLLSHQYSVKLGCGFPHVDIAGWGMYSGVSGAGLTVAVGRLVVSPPPPLTHATFRDATSYHTLGKNQSDCLGDSGT